MKKIYSMFILFAFVCFGALTAQAEDLTLTVADGTSLKQQLPMHGYYGDQAQHNQFIFLSSELSSMSGATITALKFYMDKNYTWKNNDAPTATFRFKEVTETTVASQITVDETFQQVFSGTIVFANNEWNITLDEPYSYNGGNLLIDVQTTAAQYINNNSNKGSYFYSANVTYGRGNYRGTALEYIPKTTFTYEEAAAAGGCNKPKSLAISAELPDGATFTWAQNADETVYQWACVTSGASVEAWSTLAENIRTKTVEGLTAGSAYDFYVRSYCGEGEDEQSDAVKQTFTPSCPAPTFGENPVTAKTAATATIEWNAADGISKYQYICVEKNATPNWEEAKEATTTSASVIGLTAYTEYDFYVRSWYSATSISDAVKTTFRTECAAVNAPITWDFKGETSNTVPGCWDNSGSTSTNSASEYYYVWGVYNEMLRMCNYYVKPSGGSIALMNTPSVVMPASPEMELSFEYTHNSNAGDFTVKISKDAGANWTDLATYAKGSGSSYSDPGTMTPVSISLADYAGETIILQFYAPANYGSGAIFVDNISIKERPACAKPTGLGFSEKAAHSVKLAWTSDASAWKVEYSENSDFSSSTIKSATENPYILSELDANTHYYVRVKTDCGESGESEPTDAIDFTTDCDPKILPFPEDFESGTFNECGSVDSRWEINTNAHAGSYCARFNSADAADLVLPSITIDDDAMLYYWHASSYPTGAVLVNGTQVQTIATTTNGNWKKDSVDLTSYKGQTITITIRGNYYYSGRYLYVDDILVDYKPVAKPTELTVTPGNETATIAWESEEGASWNLRYRVVGAENWIDSTGLTAKTKELTELTNGSNYEVQVQAVCSEHRVSDWTASTNFMPQACPSVSNITLSGKTYNGVTVSWSLSGTGKSDVRYQKGELGWVVAASELTETSYTFDDLETFAVYSFQVKASCGDGDSWVDADETYTPDYTTPTVGEITAITDAAATFAWSAVADATGYQYTVARKDVAADWTAKAAVGAEVTSATIDTLKAGVTYVFYVRSAYPTGTSAADSKEFATITIAPKSLAVSEISNNSAKLAWSKDGATTAFEYAVGDDADNLEWHALAEDKLDYTLTELTSNTSYTFYVRTKYSDELKSDSVWVSFTTDCDAVTELPWNENFDDMTTGSVPGCWKTVDANKTNYPSITVKKTNSYLSLSSNGLFFEATNANYGYIMLPKFEAELNTLQIAFSHKAENSSYSGKIELGYFKDGEFTLLKAYDKSTTLKVEEPFALTTAPKGARLAFRYIGNYSSFAYANAIDDITISAIPTCIKPVLAAPVILPDGATFTWSAGNGETQFQYRVDEDDWTTLDENKLSVTLHGYAPSVAHTFYVRAYCSESDQSEAVSTSFTAFCPAPTAPEVSDITTTTATLSWTAAAGINDYQYQLNGGEWIKVAGATSVALEGLTASTAYSVLVRSFFNETIQSGNASVNFNTACGAVALPFEEAFGGTIPCWTLENCHESTGINEGKFRFYYNSNPPQYLITPEITASEKEVKVEFEYNAYSGSYEESFKVGYSTTTNDLEAFTWGDEIKTKITTAQQYSEIFPAGVKFVAIQYTANNKYYFFVDNFSITEYEAPACAVPTDLAVGEIGVDTAVVTWTSEASEFAMQVSFDEKSSWVDVNDPNGISSPYVLDGLDEHITCYVRVKAVCGEENESAWTEPVEFTTECEAVNMLDEDFSTGVPECWKTSGTWSTDNDTYGSAAPSLKYNATGAGEITTVAVNVTKEEAVLQFNIKNDYYNYGTYYRAGRVIVKAAEVEDFSTDFINSKDIANVQVIDLAAYYGKKITITFQVDAASKGNVFFDDVQVRVKPCDTPKNLNATASLDSVVLVWEQGGDETTYQYSVVKKGAEADWKTLEAGVRTVTVKNLLTDTLYTASVRSFCGEGREGETVLTKDFTPLCPLPSDIVITDITVHGAHVAWTAAAGIEKYQWSLVEDEWLDEHIVAATSVDLTELDAATTYTIYVRSYNNATSVSAAINAQFTTDCDSYSMAFAEDFNGLSAGIPNCWDNTAGTTDFASYRWNYYATGREGACVRFDSYNNSANNTNILKTPSIEIDAEKDKPELSFNFKNPAGGAFAVMVYDVTADDTTALELGELTGVAEWTQKTADLKAFKGHIVQVWFHGTSNSAAYGLDGYIYLDDVSVAEHKDTPSAIGNVGAEGEKVVKRMENGILYIIRDGIKYNAQGGRISE